LACRATPRSRVRTGARARNVSAGRGTVADSGRRATAFRAD
jgi:hypothetical protein